ncbi:hypothetical protein VTI74DRAFT_3579 [Chaetomium olivicolor]
MQKTKVLSALRGIFPPLHQPLPLDRRESQQLLESLKQSFRTQLDQEYGSTRLAKPTMTYLPSNAAQPQAKAAEEHGSARATDRHLHAILHNPLFGAVGSKKAAGGFENPWDAHKLVFEKAVSRGLMNLQRAHGFLALVKSEVGQSATLSLPDGLKSTGAGLLVIEWLRSSGQERDLSFTENSLFTKLLLEFAVAEGLDHVVWEWISRLMQQEGASQLVNVGPGSSSKLLRQLVVAKSRSTELEGAYTLLLDAEAMVAATKRPIGTLRHAWDHLAWATTVNSGHHAKPPVDLFDRFAALGPAIPSSLLNIAHVHLYHPLNPSPDLALRYFSRQKTWELINDKALQDTMPRLARRISALGIDTVQHLIRVNETRQASRVWELLQKHLSWLNRPAVVV